MIKTSSRHQKKIGEFDEYLVCNFLSRSSFEVTIADHTGLDIVAFDPATKRRLGISVKSRTRHVGGETASVNLFKKGKRKDDRQKLVDACVYFNCEHWIPISVEWTDGAELYLTTLENYEPNMGEQEQQLIRGGWARS